MGNGRRQAVDLIDVRLLHHFQKLTGVSRQGFDVAALALRVDGVEGEGRFPGAREAGKDDQLVAWNCEVDVLEIVLARATNRKARELDPAVGLRFALMTSSIRGVPVARGAQLERCLRKTR